MPPKKKGKSSKNDSDISQDTEAVGAEMLQEEMSVPVPLTPPRASKDSNLKAKKSKITLSDLKDAIKGGKSKKMPAQNVQMAKKKAVSSNMFSEAQKTTEDIGQEYRTEKAGLLQEITEFRKSNLRRVDQDMFDSDDESEDDDEDVPIQTAQKTLSQKLLCYNFWDGNSYPTHKLSFIILQIDAKAEITLDFTGIGPLTDLTFLLLTLVKKKEPVRCDAVKRVILDGNCHITDSGLAWLSATFSKIKWLSIVGCTKITNSGMIAVGKACPDLISIDLSSTDVYFLPERWLNAEGMKMTCCPMLFPLAPADNASKGQGKQQMKPRTKDLFNICILTRDENSSGILEVLKGVKTNSLPHRVTQEQKLPVNENLTATVIEGPQTLANLLVTSRSVVVIPSQLKDKTKIHEEASFIAALIIEILGRDQSTIFLLVGCSTDAAGIIPTDMVREEVETYLSKIEKLLDETNYPLQLAEKMEFAAQLDHASARRLHKNLVNKTLQSLEINLDKAKDDGEKLKKKLSSLAEGMDVIKEITYSKEIFDWADTFHTKCPKALQSGIISLATAANAISASTKLNERLRSYGAGKFLASIGKLISWTNIEGQTFVANCSWLCQCLDLLLSRCPAASTSEGKDPIIDNQTQVWTLPQLQEEATKRKLDWTELQDVMKEFDYLFFVRSDIMTTMSNLMPTPLMSLKIFADFDKDANDGCLHISYSFALNQNMTPAILQTIIARCLKLHKPLHQWRNGLIIYDSIVAVMIGHIARPPEPMAPGSVGYCKLINLCAYMTAIPSQGQDKYAASLIWSTVEKYRLIVLSTLCEAGMIWEEICRSSSIIYPPPEGVKCPDQNHVFVATEVSPCSICGITSMQASMLSSMDMLLSPKFLKEDSVKSRDLKGFINGSLIELSGPSKAMVKTSLDPLGCRKCSVSLIQGNVRLLKLVFESQGKKTITVNLSESTISWDSNSGSEKFTEESKNMSYQGVVITARLRGNDPLYMDIYMGPRLVKSVQVSFERHYLHMDAENFKEDSQAVFTVQGTNFQVGTPVLQVGMRLEALDRKTPSLICVATINQINEETNEILIHFDGWTSTYDYWTNFSTIDLHPLGYMQTNGSRLQRENRKNPKLQEPHGYGKTFDWLTYLREVDAEPVPYELFSEEQIQGTPDTETSRVQNGLDSISNIGTGTTTESCRLKPFRASCLELKATSVLLEMAKNMNAGDDKFGAQALKLLDKNKHLFCFLPGNMSVDSLRFPTMKSICVTEEQRLHYMCRGQVLDFHLVNHSGFEMLKSSFTDLKAWSSYLGFNYAMLLLQKFTLPKDISGMCTGTEAVPGDKMNQLELAMKRLYQLYLEHCLFYNMKDESLNVNQIETVSSMFDSALKSSDQSFVRQFSQSPGQTEILCSAHRLANSPSSSVQEISTDMFQGLASNIYVIHLENNPLTSLPADFFTQCMNLTQLWLDGCNITEFPDMQKATSLEEIHVKGNKLTTLPESLKQMKYLRILDISNNPLEFLPPVISSLTSLVELYADNIGTVDLSFVCPLTKLNKLSVSFNFIDCIPEKMAQLPLTSLSIAGLPLLACGTAFSMASVNALLDQFAVYRRLTTKVRKCRSKYKHGR